MSSSLSSAHQEPESDTAACHRPDRHENGGGREASADQKIRSTLSNLLPWLGKKHLSLAVLKRPFIGADREGPSIHDLVRRDHLRLPAALDRGGRGAVVGLHLQDVVLAVGPLPLLEGERVGEVDSQERLGQFHPVVKLAAIIPIAS